MRVLYLHNGPMSSGRANVIQVLHMCDALASLGVDVVLAAPDDGIASSSDARELARREVGRDPGIEYAPFRRVTVAGYMSNLGCRWGAACVLRNGGHFDLCITRSPLLVDLPLRRGIPTVLELHREQMHHVAWLDRWYRRRFSRWERSPDLVKVVTISSALARIWIDAGIPEEKVQVLHDGVSAEDFRETEDRLVARARLGLARDGQLVVYAGSLYPDREVESLLELARAYPRARFMAIGGPEERRVDLERERARLALDNVVFTGRVPHQDVRQYLLAADVLLMLWSASVPTIGVCSPLKVFEYMAAERIIVGYGFPTIREVLTDGRTALLATPGDYADLERKVGEALDMSYPSSMAERARSLALEQYTWGRRAEMLLKAPAS
jgi:glycosyltransferase involved in cell wall biosynthesis